MIPLGVLSAADKTQACLSDTQGYACREFRKTRVCTPSLPLFESIARFLSLETTGDVVETSTLDTAFNVNSQEVFNCLIDLVFKNIL